MKKYLAIITSMIFVLGFAASAFAIHAEIPSETQSVVAKGDTQITLGGEIRFRGEADKLSSTDDAISSYYDGRVRLSVDAQVGPNVLGRIQLESGNTDNIDYYYWGASDSSFGGTVIANNNAGKGTYQGGNSKRGDLRILESWIQYKTDYAGLKVGHMPLFLGNKLFFDHSKFGDDAIMVFATPAKGVEIAALTIKFEDQKGSNSDDQDAYVILGGYKSDVFSVGGDLTWVVMNNGSNASALLNSLTTPDVTADISGSDVYNLGVRADVNAGIARIYGDIEYQFGKLFKDTANELDVKGYAAILGVDIKLASALKLTGELGMGTGDDDGAADGDFSRFITALGADQHYTFVYDYRSPVAADAFGSAGTYGGIANTTYAKVAASGQITEPLGYMVALYWLKATETPTNVDDAIGYEGDAKITYKLAKNLTYWIEGGYLMTGDYYKDVFGNDKDMWSARHGIQLSF